MTGVPDGTTSDRDVAGEASGHDEPPADFDPLDPLDDLLSDIGLSRAEAGASVSFAGQDPIIPARHRLGTCIGVPLMAGAVAAVAFHRHRGGPAQDLHLDLRQAVHTINPGAFWHPTVNGELSPHPLIFDNPFLVTPYRTADDRWVMATAVYPHLVARWCRYLDVPPDTGRVAEVIATRDAFELEEAANALGLPICVVRTRDEWRAHEQGALLAGLPVIGLERIGDAPPRDFGESERPFDGLRVLSFTHAIAGPAVGRTLAEHGADVLCATRPNDYEHEYIYAEANVASRSAYLDLDRDPGMERAAELLTGADVVVNNHRRGSLERRGLDPHELADRYPGIVSVSVSCYGASGPWAGRGGFDMNGSAVSGLMTSEGSPQEPRFPPTFLINDYLTGYMGAVGAMAALVKRATEGGSWHVTVSLTSSAMWCGSLGLVDPALAGSDDEHTVRDPSPLTHPVRSETFTCWHRPSASRGRSRRGRTPSSSRGVRAGRSGTPDPTTGAGVERFHGASTARTVQRAGGLQATHPPGDASANDRASTGADVVSPITAEGGGFEPPEGCPSRLFKSRAFVRSAIPPDRARVAAGAPGPRTTVAVRGPGPRHGPAAVGRNAAGGLRRRGRWARSGPTAGGGWGDRWSTAPRDPRPATPRPAGTAWRCCCSP